MSILKTPVCDFVEKYIEKNALRLHMPGHKGMHGYGADITEIDGADSLYAPEGIIRESEENAGALFGADTFYSAEGASLAIRAMLALVCMQTEEQAHILAARNAHRAFISAAALLDFAVTWLPAAGESYLSCTLSAEALDKALSAQKFTAVYVTSPDYLGQILDIEGLSRVCRAHGTLLLVDNAHGAYRKFLPTSAHPIDLGADLCADSAHKTLPALTGSAYLHIAGRHSARFSPYAKEAMVLFGSTSPSYLILASIDRTNAYLAAGYRERLAAFLPQVEKAKTALRGKGYDVLSGEELKITIAPKSYGYTGEALAAILKEENCIPEFYDKDYLVLMVTPETGEEGLARLLEVLSAIPRRTPVEERPPRAAEGVRVLSPRAARLSPHETVKTEDCEGRILAAEGVSCPPAVPILVSGERIGKAHIEAFGYYGIGRLSVVKEN